MCDLGFLISVVDISAEGFKEPHFGCPYHAFRVRPDRPAGISPMRTKNASFADTNRHIFLFLGIFTVRNFSLRKKMRLWRFRFDALPIISIFVSGGRYALKPLYEWLILKAVWFSERTNITPCCYIEKLEYLITYPVLGLTGYSSDYLCVVGYKRDLYIHDKTAIALATSRCPEATKARGEGAAPVGERRSPKRRLCGCGERLSTSRSNHPTAYSGRYVQGCLCAV